MTRKRQTAKKRHFIRINDVNKDHIIISTLSESEQDCIIKNTVTPESEVELINRAIGKTSLYIIIYGKNSTDDSIYEKYYNLINHGFTNVFV